MNQELTSRQAELLRYLERVIGRRGRAPSLRQSAEEFGVSHAAIVQLLKALEEKGYVRREGRYSRTIYLLNRAGEARGMQRWREVPIVGRIAAGLPLYAQQEWEGALVVDGTMFRGANLFVLRVRGDSMSEAGILHGDLAICEPRQFARDGEIVVALVRGEEATVKRFYLRKEGVELKPENRKYKPQHYSFEEVLVQGKVVGMVRGPEQLNI